LQLSRIEARFHLGLAGREGTMSAIHNTLLITGLALAVALTIAWDGLLAYGLITVIRAL
jgi:hypothetical protein